MSSTYLWIIYYYTCNACMDPGRDRGWQVSDMYLFLSSSMSFSSCSSKPLAIASIKLWDTERQGVISNHEWSMKNWFYLKSHCTFR